MLLLSEITSLCQALIKSDKRYALSSSSSSCAFTIWCDYTLSFIAAVEHCHNQFCNTGQRGGGER